MIWLRLKISWFNFKEGLKVMWRYYGNAKFRNQDVRLLLKYLWNTPFKISKAYHQKHGDKDVYVYGETPLTTMEKIAQETEIKAEDIVYELGCGRGRTCFWLNCFTGCRVIGIDQIPDFIEIAQKIAEDEARVVFLNEDLGGSDLSKGTVFYLYNFLSDEVLEVLRQKIPKKAKVISVSFPFPKGKVIKTFSAQFPWGEAEVYLSYK